jgi:diguanylate cyclase (GGDEF)-like protein
MIDRPVRVLLVDGQMEDSRWIEELLAEIEMERFGGGWMHGFEMFHVQRLAEALALLAASPADQQFDIVLLNLNLPDSTGLHAYLRLEAQAREIPLVILADEEDRNLAISMVRAGAQDFLIKAELDGPPLARALRLAIERNRIVRNLHNLCWRDERTGLANQHGFTMLAEQGLGLADRFSRAAAVMVVELEGLDQVRFSYGREEEELALIEAGELIRGMVEPPDTAGRIGRDRFAFLLIPGSSHDVPSFHSALSMRLLRFAHSKVNRSSLKPRMGLAWRHPGETRTAADLICAAVEKLRAGTSGQSQPAGVCFISA